MDSLHSSYSLSCPLRGFFEHKAVQSAAFKTTTCALGVIFLIVAAAVLYNTLSPHSLSLKFMEPLTQADNIAIISTFSAAGGISVALFALSIYFRKKETTHPSKESHVNFIKGTSNESKGGTSTTSTKKKDDVMQISDEISHNLSKASDIHSITQNDMERLTAGSIKWAEDQNNVHRRSMEDTHISDTLIINNKKVFLAAVFDGHGGRNVPEFLQQNMKQYIEAELQNLKEFSRQNIEQAIAQAFAKLDQKIEELDLPGGSCCAMTLIIEGYLFAINLGDSRIVLKNKQKIHPLTEDAKATEESRWDKDIKCRGGVVFHMVSHTGVPLHRVQGQLAVATSFGDFSVGKDANGQKWISAQPDIRAIEISQLSKGDCLIIACDGIWDVLSNEEAMEIATKEKSEEQAAASLLNEALKRSTTDNLTAGVLFF